MMNTEQQQGLQSDHTTIATTTTTAATPSKAAEETASLLEIHSPVGNHGDAVVGLQINYANKAAVRRRLVEDASKPPVGGAKSSQNTQKSIEQRQERAKSFLALSEQAVAQANPTLSLQALQNLAQIDSTDEASLFSVASAHAKNALVQLQSKNDPDACRVAKATLQASLHRRSRNWILIVIFLPLLVAGSFYLDRYDQEAKEEIKNIPNNDPVQIAVMWISYMVAVTIGYHTLRQRDLESKQLVHELYMIASSSKKGQEEAV